MQELTFLATTLVASYFNIALRAFQQLNVMHDRKMFVLPTSMLMSGLEIVVIVNNAMAWELKTVLVTGVGAGFGALTAMAVHRKVR